MIPIKTFIVLLFLLLYCLPVYAANEERYSETIRALFARLRTTEETSPVNGQAEKPPPEPPAPDNDPPERNNVPADPHEGETIIPPIPSFDDRTIMERLQDESSLSITAGGAIRSVDTLSTSVFNFITRALAGLSPILLIVGAFMALFSKGKAFGVILFVGVGLFVVFNAPEITKIFLSFIMNAFGGGP